MSVNAQALTLEELKESLALKIDTSDLSSEELMEKGLQYENGEGVVQWYAMAKAYYEAAKETGNEEAETALERLDGVKKEMLDNSPDGQGDVFEFFRTGVTAGQGGDYEKAYAVSYDDAFFFEDPLYRGIGNLGDLLRDGNGVEQDIEKAVSIYEFNAEVLGKGNGYTSLGLLYSAEDGTYPGIEHSTDKAMEYFLKSYQDESLEETDFKGPRYAADLFDEGYDHDDGKPSLGKAVQRRRRQTGQHPRQQQRAAHRQRRTPSSSFCCMHGSKPSFPAYWYPLYSLIFSPSCQSY